MKENEIVEVRQSIHGRNAWVADIQGVGYHDGGYVQPDGTAGDYFDYRTKPEAEDARDIYFMNQDLMVQSSAGGKETNPKDAIRTFETGATRDTVEGKLDYVKALSPIVLRRYVQYLDKHRLQPDGSMRDFDNWKRGIPQETYHSSGGRHFFASWLLTEGYAAEDNHGPVMDIEDTLCAEIFNKMGQLHEILKTRLTKE